MAKKKAKKATFADYKKLGALLYEARELMLYKFRERKFDEYRNVLDKLRSRLDDEVFVDYPEKETRDLVHVFYGHGKEVE